MFEGQNGKKIFDLCLPNIKDAQKNSDKSDLVLTFEQVPKPLSIQPKLGQKQACAHLGGGGIYDGA